eukprot:109705-Prorocentrum_minimum.AAC.1
MESSSRGKGAQGATYCAFASVRYVRMSDGSHSFPNLRNPVRTMGKLNLNFPRSLLDRPRLSIRWLRRPERREGGRTNSWSMFCMVEKLEAKAHAGSPPHTPKE